MGESTVLSFKIRPQLLERLKQQIEKDGLTMSELIRASILQYLESKKQ